MAAASTDLPALFGWCFALLESDGTRRLWKWDCNNHRLIVRLISFSLSPISPCKMVENEDAVDKGDCCQGGMTRKRVCVWKRLDVRVCSPREKWTIGAALMCICVVCLLYGSNCGGKELCTSYTNKILTAWTCCLIQKNVISIWKDYRRSATNYNPCCPTTLLTATNHYLEQQESVLSWL